ncbi:MAG: FprA family A-type flavoprotein [Bacteroidales bacterium]|nr:FprA family A-type flavoprotein [Bacteroidales bacterium]
MDILQVSDDVHWIGVLDHDIVTFDIVMETQFGTTYNSYFINADRKAVVETVKKYFWPEYEAKLRKVVRPEEVEFILCNHTEPDHSGCIGQLLKLAPDATVIGSGQALNYLSEMIEGPFKSLKVKDGDIVDLGNKKLRIIGAPNLHWPDTIYSYLEEDRILFTCDSFGAHYAQEAMFDDLIEEKDYREAFKYYFDVILKPYSKFMLKAIEKILPLSIRMICPGHGPILRSTWKEKVDLSRQYATDYLQESGQRNRVLIAYISAYGYTGEMAARIAEGLEQTGSFDIDMVDIEHIHLGDLEEKMVRADSILIGSPTINQNTLLPVYRLFSIMSPIRDKGKPAAVFGSYGWSGEAVKLIEDHLKNLKFNVVMEGLPSKFYPGGEKAMQLVDFGKRFGAFLLTQS